MVRLCFIMRGASGLPEACANRGETSRMANNMSLTPLSQDDYEAIEAAVMETGRGRWFLAEFAKRNRVADTNMLLEAMARLEGAVGGERMPMQVEHIRSDLMEMAKTIAQLKIDLASDDPEMNRFEQATEALDAVVRTTEGATSSILEAAEQIQELAWSLREGGANSETCDTLDQRAADIYTACSFQDLTAQRTKKVVGTLRSIEGRINGLVDAWNTTEKTESRPVYDPTPIMPFERRAQEHIVRIGHSHMSHDDIDFVMREEDQVVLAGELILEPMAEERPEEAPASVAVSADAHEDMDIAFIECAPEPTPGPAPDASAAEVAFEAPVSPASQTLASQPLAGQTLAGQSLAGQTLAAIDMLPPRAKLGLFA
jgi:chemotaxis regulatin CheY-phosphate phosphatase CheZ